MCNKKFCKKCSEEKSPDLFSKSNRTKDGKQRFCKVCLAKQARINKEKRKPNIKPKHGFKVCSKCKINKHVDEFYLNPNLSMGIHSECKECTKKKVALWAKDNPEKLKEQLCRKYKPKERKVKEVVTEKICKDCKTVKQIEDFNKNTNRCKDCLKVYTKNRSCSIEVTEKACGRCKVVQPKDFFIRDMNTPTGLSSKCRTCRKQEYERRKSSIMSHKRVVHNHKYKHDSFYRLVYTIRGRVRNSLRVYLQNNEKKSKHSESILGCSWQEFREHIESQFLPWMNWDNFGDSCGDSPDYNCSWDLDHIIPMSWAKNNKEVYSLNHWSNFQPLCSKVNRWEKKGNTIPLCNTVLKITVD